MPMNINQLITVLNRNSPSRPGGITIAKMDPALTDPQTSGGLLVACAPEAANKVLEIFRAKGFAQAAVIGRLEAGAPGVKVSK